MVVLRAIPHRALRRALVAACAATSFVAPTARADAPSSQSVLALPSTSAAAATRDAAGDDYETTADGTQIRTRYDLDRRVYVGLLGGGSNAGGDGRFGATNPRVDFGLRLAYLTDTALWRVVHEIAGGTWEGGGGPLGRLTASDDLVSWTLIASIPLMAQRLAKA